MKLSELKAFIEKNGGVIDTVGHQTHGYQQTAYVYADVLERSAEDFDMSDVANVTVEDWGSQVLFEIDISWGN